MNRLIIIALIISFTSCLKSEWGHIFEFKNELNQPIDSLTIIIGDHKNSISTQNSSGNLYGNLDLPNEGDKTPVKFIIYSGTEKIELKADSFGSFNADGTHEYILKKPQAKYEFHH